MVVATKLQHFLDKAKIRYKVLPHPEKFTSPEIAQAVHVPGQELAKVVIVKVDGKLAMAVLPANYQVSLDAFAKMCRAKRAALATEEEFGRAFPDCEVGAMPPFGSLYNVPTYVDRSLTIDKTIVFEAGNHREAIRLAYADFARLEKPVVGDFAAH